MKTKRVSDVPGQPVYPHARNRISGLTLVELIVVIAIVILLTGLLGAVYSGAVRAGKVAKCTSQMSQIGRAYELYSEQNDGYIPPYYLVAGGISVPRTPEPRLVVKSIKEFGPVESMWFCPADPYKGTQFKLGGDMDHTATSYIYGLYLLGKRDKTKPWLSVSLASVPQPSRTVLLTEMAWGTDPTGLDAPHGKRRNELFFDGHVKDVSTSAALCHYPGQHAGCPE